MRKLLIIFCVLLASFIMVQSSMAAEGVGGVLEADEVNAVVGFRWDHCDYAYHAIGSSRTYCRLTDANITVWTSDDRAEQILIACAESNHWCGVNFTSTGGSWSYVKMWKY